MPLEMCGVCEIGEKAPLAPIRNEELGTRNGLGLIPVARAGNPHLAYITCLTS